MRSEAVPHIFSVRTRLALEMATTIAVIGGLAVSCYAETFGTGANTFNIDFVLVGDAGNVNDPRTGYGGVPYTYRMAVTDVSEAMVDAAINSGGVGLFGWAWSSPNQPAAHANWYQAAAFVNWLNTSTGHQAAYNLTYSGGTWSMSLWNAAQAWQKGGQNLFRNAGAYYFLPSDNEWYKAAFYNGNSYNLYAVGSDTAPIPVSSGTAAGTAVYLKAYLQGPAAVNQSGGLSHYGTQGQTGNVMQWIENTWDNLNTNTAGNRVLRGGMWFASSTSLASTYRTSHEPSTGDTIYGFRVASVLPLPVITSSLTVTTTQCQAFSYQITASNAPTGYGASGLPTGLGVDSSTGCISGTSGTPGSFSITMTAVNESGTASAVMTLNIQTPYAAWQTAYFGPGAPDSTAGEIVVNNTAGITNLMSCGLGTNPYKATVGNLPILGTMTVSGTDYLTLTFTRNGLATDITYVVESSTDLQNTTDWTPVSMFSAGAWTPSGNVAESGSGTIINVQVQDNQPRSSATARFLRLKVSH